MSTATVNAKEFVTLVNSFRDIDLVKDDDLEMITVTVQSDVYSLLMKTLSSVEDAKKGAACSSQVNNLCSKLRPPLVWHRGSIPSDSLYSIFFVSSFQLPSTPAASKASSVDAPVKPRRGIPKTPAAAAAAVAPSAPVKAPQIVECTGDGEEISEDPSQA